MVIPDSLKVALKYLVLAVTVVAGLGPTVARLAGVLPAVWLTDLSHVVTVAGAIQLWLTESPLFQPLLATKPPQAVIQAAGSRMASTRPPPPLPPLPPPPPPKAA